MRAKVNDGDVTIGATDSTTTAPATPDVSTHRRQLGDNILRRHHLPTTLYRIDDCLALCHDGSRVAELVCHSMHCACYVATFYAHAHAQAVEDETITGVGVGIAADRAAVRTAPRARKCRTCSAIIAIIFAVEC